MIGIIIAMQQELEPYKKHIIEQQQIYGKVFYLAQIAENKIVICQSGIGKVNAAFATTLMIERYTPSVIINTGVSGGLGLLKPHDIVMAEKVVQHDVDTSALGNPKGMVSTINKIYFETSEKINSIMSKYVEDAKWGIIACGDQFIADKNLINQIVGEFNAIACDMESGAVAQVAHIAGVELAIIRAISDNADEKAPIDFQEMLKVVSYRLYQTVKKVIENL